MDGIILGLQFFTRLPIKKSVDYNDKNLSLALLSLPLAGAITGLLTGLVLWISRGLKGQIGPALGVLAYYLISGGLHLDGLADMADGFWANRGKEETLKIMSDSLIGSFGTMSLIVYFILKFAIYSALDQNIIVKAFIISLLSRSSVLLSIKNYETAKKTGLAKEMHRVLKDKKIVYLILSLIYLGLLIYDRGLIVPILASQLLRIIISKLSEKKIGGLSGDIYGAINEMNDILVGILVV